MGNSRLVRRHPFKRANRFAALSRALAIMGKFLRLVIAALFSSTTALPRALLFFSPIRRSPSPPLLSHYYRFWGERGSEVLFCKKPASHRQYIAQHFASRQHF